MRTPLITLLLLSASALPLAARADTDLFTLTGGGHTETWTLPSTETFDYPAVPIFSPSFTPVTEDLDGSPVSPIQSIDFFPTGRGLTLTAAFGTLTGPSVIDVLSESGPFPGSPDYDIYTLVFDTGAFSRLAGGATDYTLTIAAQPTPTPEPSSLLLFATGLALGCALYLRSRRSPDHLRGS
jgi:hypothetical protein